jgi:outer membrane lipoprotein-sorting protein
MASIRIFFLLLFIFLLPFIVGPRIRIRSQEISLPGALPKKEIISAARGKEEIVLQYILKKINEAYRAVEDYQCICIAEQLSRFGRKMHKPKVLRLSFKKPELMHAIGLQGVEEGAEAVYREGKIRATHHRYIPFTLTFDVDSVIARSPRHGLRVDKCTLGGIIERINYYQEKGEIEPAGIEDIAGRECYSLVMIPHTREGKHPIVKETVWIDKTSFLPVRHVLYEEGGRLAESRTFQDLEINIGLPDELFDISKRSWRRKKG